MEEYSIVLGLHQRDLRGVDLERAGELRDQDEFAVPHALNGSDQTAAVGERDHVSGARRNEHDQQDECG
jgi:hypothetical protein